MRTGGSGVVTVRQMMDNMNRLRNELAIADTAKIAYVNALKQELDKNDNANKSLNN